jgi:hypothetical protein
VRKRRAAERARERFSRSSIGLSGGAPPEYNPVTALGVSLLAWWDAEHASLITVDGSSRIASWRDSIGALDLTQGTDANKPVLAATETPLNRPAATFDGTNDELTLAATTGLSTGGALGEVWCLVKQAALAADTTARFAFAYGGNAAATRRSVDRIVDTGVNRYRAGSGDGTNQRIATVTTVDFSGWSVVRHVCTIDEIAGLNGPAILASGTAGAAHLAGTTRTRMGASTADTAANFWNGSVAAVLVTSALTNPQADSLARWLNGRRGVV